MHICFFDIDGTLILSGGAGQAAFERTFIEDFGTDRWNGNVAFSGRSDRAIVGDIFAILDIPATTENWERFAAGYISRLPQTLAECDGYVLPGVEGLLEQLTARPDVAVGLLTGNTAAGADRKLTHFGLADYFSFGAFGDELLDRNDIAAAAARDAHARFDDIARVLVIGDTDHDVRCARAIGATAIGVATGFCARETLVASQPDLLLDDLSDPSPVLELLGPCRS